MGARASHHWIPQHHLRLFAGGARSIQVALRDGSQFIDGASIKGQCARQKLYGHDVVEEWLGRLESRHALVFKAIVDIACGTRSESLSKSESRNLREALLLQHARTPRSARVHGSSAEKLTLNVYLEYLQSQPPTSERRALKAALESGKVRLRHSELFTLLQSLDIASQAQLAISDLSVLILRNRANRPYVLGDSPCIFSNHYMRRLRNYGTLGYFQPGLMIALPLNSSTQVLLYDSSVYAADGPVEGCRDLDVDSDVDMLNVLQVYAAERCVYSSDPAHRPYVQTLLGRHPAKPSDHEGGILVGGKLVVQGRRQSGELVGVYEPQLPETLDLSFLTTSPLPSGLNLVQPRNPALAWQAERIMDGPPPSGRLDIKDMARWVEAEMMISGDT